jgi:2-polyprenyl-3-methyl-5-hydroxy-6-metoxy-1,4-benzoquinol methylase
MVCMSYAFTQPITSDIAMPADESTLLQSWHHNAQSWIEAVRSGAIESRLKVTDQAILLAVLGRQPERVLDLGCGEGWLLRALTDRGIEAAGVDGDATLVEAARAAGASSVYLASYQELAEAKVQIGNDYNLICANFALLHQDIIPLLAAMNALLAPGGALVIQTLHPWTAAAVVFSNLVQLGQCAGHGRLSAGWPAGAAAPAKPCAAVVAVGG